MIRKRSSPSAHTSTFPRAVSIHGKGRDCAALPGSGLRSGMGCRGDLAGACADFHPDVEYRDLQHPPDAPETVRGISAMLDVLGQWQQSFPDLISNVEEFIDAGDAVVVVTRWHARGAGSGIGVDNLTADVYEFSHGLVIRATVGYEAREAALRVLGLEE